MKTSRFLLTVLSDDHDEKNGDKIQENLKLMDEAYQVFRSSCLKHKENETVGKGTKCHMVKIFP